MIELLPQCQIETVLRLAQAHLVEAGHWEIRNTAGNYA